MIIKLSDQIGINIVNGKPINCFYIVDGNEYNEDLVKQKIILKSKECGWDINLSTNRLDYSVDYKNPFMITYKII